MRHGDFCGWTLTFPQPYGVGRVGGIDMRKLIYVFVLIIIVAGIFLYMEQKNMAKHSTIQACENVVQSALKAPDT